MVKNRGDAVVEEIASEGLDVGFEIRSGEGRIEGGIGKSLKSLHLAVRGGWIVNNVLSD